MSNAISTYATITSKSTASVVINNYLYVTGEKTHMVRVNLDTGVVENQWLSTAQGFKSNYYGAYAIAGDSQYVYSIMPYTYTGINISRTPYDNPNGGEVDWVKNDTPTGSYFLSAYHYGGNIYIGQSEGGKIYRVNTTSKAISLFYTHPNNGLTAMVHYNGFLYYFCNTTRGLFKVSITNPVAGSAQLVTNSGFWGSSQILSGLTVYNDNLFVSFQGANTIGQLGLIDTSKFNTTFSNNANINGPTGIVVYNGSLYIVNYSSASLNKVTVPALYLNLTTPNSISIDTGNTYTVASGNVQVSIIDASNSTSNAIFYWYSTDGGNTYTQTTASPSGSAAITTRFYITGLSFGQKTIYVIAKNTLGNSNVVSTSLTVYSAPLSPTAYTASFSLNTGIQVTITDTNNVPANNIYYYYYYFRTGDTTPNQSNNLAVYSNSYVPLSTGSTTFFIQNLLKGDYTVYVAAVNAYGGNIYTPAPPPVAYICFKEDSRILTNVGYKKIQHLRKGDMVKTFKNGFKPIYKIGKKEITYSPTSERSKEHLYKCSTTQYPGLFEDLVLTGCHSILVDDFADDEQIRKTEETLGSANYITDDKLRLPVCADRRASIYEKAGKHMVYHIALEHDDYYMNYGIYANGLLVESTSKRFLEQFPIMET